VPRKIFVAGEILTAADLQANAVDQSVMTFAGTAARGSAIPSPSEGMVTYLNDVDALNVYDGSAWVPAASGATLGAGTILQVVSTTKTDTFSSSSTSYTGVTGLSASITPRSISSKVLVLSSIATGFNGTNGAAVHMRLAGGNASTYVGDAAGNRIQSVISARESSSNDLRLGTGAMLQNSMMFLDSPATASSVTYSIEGRTSGSGTFYVNRSVIDTDNAEHGRGVSSITLLEVAA
jgi:hypothetical protein